MTVHLHVAHCNGDHTERFRSFGTFLDT